MLRKSIFLKYPVRFFSFIVLCPLVVFCEPKNETAPSLRGKRSDVPLHRALFDEIDSENFPDLIKSFDYPNAQIADIVLAMSHLTGINFIIDPGIKGTVSIVAPTPITVAEAFQAFLSALAINGYALVRSGAFWKVTSAENASRDNLQIYKGEYFPDADQYITKVFKLKHANVKNLEKHLKQFLTKDKHKAMFYEQANTIIISDYGSSIEKISQIIKELDVPDVHTIVEVVHIQYALASDLALKLQTLLSQSPSPSVSSIRGRRAGSNLITPKRVNTTGISAIIPDERTNSIIISGSKKGITKTKALIKKLDFYINPQTAGGIYVYYVKHGKAKDMEETLNNILGSQIRSTQGKNPRANIRSFRDSINLQRLFNQTGIQDNIRVTHDKNTNSLLITSNKHSYEVLKNILNKIDIPKNQVFIKTIIMDMNAEDDLNWNLNYYNFLSEGIAGFLPRVAFSSKNIFDIFREGISGKATGSILNFGSYALGSAQLNVSDIAKMATGASVNFNEGKNIPIPGIIALVNILKKKTNGNILSTPQIIAIDNEPSSISVGFDVPVGESSQTTTTGISSTTQDRRDVSTTLEIIPYINPDGQSVRLQIEQKIDSIDPTTRGPKELEGKSITITKRAIKTNIILNDQETAVLGGLMNDVETERVQKVPVLGDIPFIGWLFRAKDLDKRKKNLIVFITPKIIKTTFDHQIILQDKIDEKIDFIKNYMGGKKGSKKRIHKLLSHVSKKQTPEIAPQEPPLAPEPPPSGKEDENSLKSRYNNFIDNNFDE